jgi:hypothetical protein
VPPQYPSIRYRVGFAAALKAARCSQPGRSKTRVAVRPDAHFEGMLALL